MTRRAEVGVVGCGMIAQLMHLPYLAELRDRFTTVAVCDRQDALARRVAARFGVPDVYGTCEEMLAAHPGLDAVLVLDKDHFQVARTALEHGKHTFTEKPLCYTLAEAQQLTELSRSTGAKLMVGYMKRYDSGVRRGLEEIARIGRPLMARAHLVVGPDHGNWIVPQLTVLEQPAQPVDTSDADGRLPKALLELGAAHEALLPAYMEMFGVWSHDINLLRAAFPGPPVSIKAHASPDGGIFSALLQYEGGLQAVFQGGSTSVRRFEEGITVWGADRTVAMEISNPFLRHAPSTVRITRNDTQEPGPPGPAVPPGTVDEQVITGDHDEAFRAQLCHFHECVTTDTQPVTGAEETLADIRLMVDMIKAAAAGAP